VITSAMSLALGFANENAAIVKPLVPYVISILTRLVVNRSASSDYLYYRTPSPWLQVKCLRFLQYYEIPDRTQTALLTEILSTVMRTEISDSVNKSNADHSILFEAVKLIIHYGPDIG
jgi:AP-2 complex subunit alpha